MPSRLVISTARKAISALCPAQPSQRCIASASSLSLPLRVRPATMSSGFQRRFNSTSNKDAKEGSKDPAAPLPSVNEEAAEIEKIMHRKCDGGVPATPELEQGSPIAEILNRDEEAKKHMPKVMQDQIKASKGTRSFSTFARRQTDIEAVSSPLSVSAQTELELEPGLKFAAPSLLAKTENFRRRYDTLLEQFTKLLMRDGKLSVAQRHMSAIIDHLRTSSPPTLHPKRRLLAGPPGPQLPLNPVLYMTMIVDSVAPLIKIRQQRGIIGGGAAIQIPVPLSLRQRRRTAIRWIVDASDKRRDSHFAQRVANELIAVAEGRSGVWDRRETVHKLGVVGRSNLALMNSRRTVYVLIEVAVPLPPAQSFELVEFTPLTESTRPPRETARGPNRQEKRGGSEQAERGQRRLRFWVQALRLRARRENTAAARDKMKFSHSLQFNAVPEWSTHYIAYSNLKKLIYTLEKQAHRDGQTAADLESAPLLDSSRDPDSVFRRALDVELEKICAFYRVKELEILADVDELIVDQDAFALDTADMDMGPVTETVIKARSRASRMGSLFRARQASTVSEEDMNLRAAVTGDEDEDEDSDDEEQSLSEQQQQQQQKLPPRLHGDDETVPSEMTDSNLLEYSRTLDPMGRPGRPFDDPRFLALYNTGVSLKKRAVEVYVALCGLKSYIQLNRTGFTKILKKYDKTLDRSLRREYLALHVAAAAPFLDTTMQRIDEHISRIEHAYAQNITNGDVGLARRELRLHLREHVVWERNTVWREMIGIERKAQAANVGIRRTLLGGEQDPAASRRQGDGEPDDETRAAKELSTPLGRYRVPQWLCSLSFVTLLAIVLIFALLLSVPIMDRPEQQNCLAMLVFVSLLWATEVIPLFVTSLLIPFLVILLGIMRAEEKPHERLAPKQATKVVFAAMWTPVIMLLLGGFTIAAALSKHDIARRMAMLVLSQAGSQPRAVLLTSMFVSMFLSMWISNVASPVLCYSILQPLLRNLPPDSTFARALVLGIALAANVGGAASPIASPQNIIALQNMSPSPSWGTWFFVALPVCIISILLIWVLLLVTFPSGNTTIVPIRPVRDRFSGVQVFISLVTLTTIALWCASHQLEHIFGDMGVIAIIPLVVFFGTGILTKEDFNNFLWTIIILAAGGLALGSAVTSSGLLHTIARAITARVAHFSLYGVLLVFGALILVIATFISHTVAALIILPLVRQIGAGMADPHPNLLVMASALMCSVAMGLPTSGFPNMTAIMTEVPQTGQRYLQVRHFLTRGIPASILSFMVIVTIGYGLMYVGGL
ncbi:hypothetical protein ASPZODRAFT_24645 [Penicilliopsis zonata CBS 506.65]|uniref:Small ribosomal subunit protein uS7m n=1 Tax=Penicilliopsis zonata CBS 506.65 TaxID=1073090 RepID=A0A1L9SKL4_9EURO|nr:hypothetical protein ASPZODRAFT_24645 [Penicilliopsis zonata CBS 506.65]OJJ47748.1 hypothetical protein ASPZODRAFT_24645 [Penicilliopsis zonata CBS 506.65]